MFKGDQLTPYLLRNFKGGQKQGAMKVSADLFCENQRVATVKMIPSDPGHIQVELEDGGERILLVRHIARLTSEGDIASDIDIARFVGQLIENEYERQWLRGRCKKATLFRVTGDTPDEWREFPGRYTKTIADTIRSHLGDKLERIANEGLLRRAGGVGTMA